jgi:hypothetical protein
MITPEYDILGLKVGRYEIGMMNAALGLHEYATGSNECYQREDELFYGFLKARLADWTEGPDFCAEFDNAVKRVVELAIQEYEAWRAKLQQHGVTLPVGDLPKCIHPKWTPKAITLKCIVNGQPTEVMAEPDEMVFAIRLRALIQAGYNDFKRYVPSSFDIKGVKGNVIHPTWKVVELGLVSGDTLIIAPPPGVGG